MIKEERLAQIILNNPSTSDPSIDSRLDGFYQQVASLIERSMTLGIAMNLVRPCDTRLTAYAIIGAIKEVILHLTSGKMPQPPVDALVKELMEFAMFSESTTSP